MALKKSPMNNIQDFIVYSKMFRTFKVDELLFAEFKCPVEASRDKVWCNNNFFAFILTGKTLVKTRDHEYPLAAGDCVFARKGSFIIESEHQKDFCELMVFVPDDFIRSVVFKYKITRVHRASVKCDTVFSFGSDEVLQAYFQSLLSYFNQPNPPPNSLLKLKFEELIVNILSNVKYLPLQFYFEEISTSGKIAISEILEDNYLFNLAIPEFARLCGRSLSAFKNEFKITYDTTPGKWLQRKRLEHCKHLLETTRYSIDEIYSNSGFENKSHFTRAFKNMYGHPPGKHRVG